MPSYILVKGCDFTSCFAGVYFFTMRYGRRNFVKVLLGSLLAISCAKKESLDMQPTRGFIILDGWLITMEDFNEITQLVGQAISAHSINGV